MKRLFQIFGGGLGWSLGGPIGALLGVAFGNMVHDLVHGEDQPITQSRQGSSPSDFHISLLVLAARVIKADGNKEFRCSKRKKFKISGEFTIIL